MSRCYTTASKQQLETVFSVGSVQRLNKELKQRISQSQAPNGQLRTSCEMVDGKQQCKQDQKNLHSWEP